MFVDAEYKDASPAETLKKIQDILESYSIPVEETWYESGVTNCYSIRVSVKGTEFGSNGKGVTKEFARASGYAELMERMQAGYMTRRHFRDNTLEFNDAVTLTHDAFHESCGKWCADIARGMSELLHMEVSAAQVEKKCLEADIRTPGEIQVLPFYDATSDCMTYFPQKTLKMLYNTNGLAAGNTLEEAFVQGFSEIVERQNLVRCFFGNIVPPTIPDDYLQQFPKSYETIQFLKAHGLDIIIKDCSLTEPYPLVAAIAIDKKTHAYHVHMGCHPVFEIALERCLTEMFQGRHLDQAASTFDLAPENTKQRTLSELISLLTIGCGRYPLSFFVGKPSYEFRPTPDRANMSNAQLLLEIVEHIRGKGYHMLVRSTSHLGFPSVRIVIPGMSEVLMQHFIDKFPSMMLLEKYKDTLLCPDTLTPEQLFEYRMFLKNQIQSYGSDALFFHNLSGRNVTGGNNKISRLLGRMVHAYVEWSFDKKTAVKYARAAMVDAEGDDSNLLSLLCTVNDYLEAGAKLEDVLTNLSMFYEPHIIAEVRQAYTAGKNPFTRFLLHCAPETCESCRFKESCNYPKTAELLETVQKATLKFDNTAAFERIKQTFRQL